MPIQTVERQTIKYYDEHAEEWVEAHHGRDEESYWKDEMKKFHKLLPHGKILEVGSGGGKDASALIRYGYAYMGTDASEGLLVVAERRNPNASFRHIAVQDLDFSDNTFDGFWTAATLLHIPKEDIDKVLMNVTRVVKPGGIGFISVKQGEGERVDPETSRLFSYYSQGKFAKILERNRMEVIESKKREDGKTMWLIYFVRVVK